MKTIAFFDTKSYDKLSFSGRENDKYSFKFFESKLNENTVSMAACCDAVCVFVNDNINRFVIDKLCEFGVKLIVLRCAGYNNVDIKYAKGKITVLRVPDYSPYSVAEHTMALLLMLNRKLHRAYIRTRDHNFSLEGLCGFDLHSKTAGIIGTGRIGRVFGEICKGFSMNVLGYDPYPSNEFVGEYVDLDTLLKTADVISLHCPLTKENRFFIDQSAIEKMKNGAYIVNTSRGMLIDTKALITGLKSGKIAGAGLDVYEEETHLFFEDYSDEVIHDDVLSTIISMPNVIVSSHQAFLTKEALKDIADTTLYNLDSFFEGKELKNQVL
ncbi:MAG: 2-hydroxyacid dehydrogenase [Clostridia bacterium]|nr:2-hydroxyacid dehydrogenase [Clostridia bacterium]